ncbi:MAG: crossover junction endodeoxyribonuclease RuvC, partial [Sphingomonadaceae bacterium]
MIVLGIDPGLGTTGWGLIEATGNRLIHLGNGQIKSPAKAPLPARLAILAHHLEEVIEEAEPDCAAIEEVFVNKNAQSTLKLAQARGALLLCCARAGLELDEYA